MSRRESVYLEGFSHANPIPVAARIGAQLLSGALTGRDSATGEMPADLDEQMTNVFARIRELMLVVGGSTDDILKLTFHLSVYRDRAALNREWEEMFPDPSSRPARQVVSAVLDGGALVHAELVAILPD